MSQGVRVRNSLGLFMISGSLGLFSGLSPLQQSSFCEFANTLREKERLVWGVELGDGLLCRFILSPPRQKMSSYKSALSSSPPFRNAFGSVKQAARGQPPRALVACEQKQSVFAGVGNVFAPGSLTFMCCLLCLGAEFHRCWNSQLVCSTAAYVPLTCRTQGTCPESAVTWPLPHAAPHHTAGLAVGPFAERVPRTLAS